MPRKRTHRGNLQGQVDNMLSNSWLLIWILFIMFSVGACVLTPFIMGERYYKKNKNAALMGHGKKKRIVINKEFESNFSKDELGVIYAHELGHSENRHILQKISVNSFIYLIIFYLIKDINSFVLTVMMFLFWSILLSSLVNLASREFEYEADAFSILYTQNSGAFIRVMEKLNKMRNNKETENKVLQFMFSSHPTPMQRIEAERDRKIRKS